MDEHLTTRIPRGVEVEPALLAPARQVRADVADQELVAKRRTLERQSQFRAEPITAGAGARDHVRRCDTNLARPGDTRDHRPAGVLSKARGPATPPHIYTRGDLESLIETRTGRGWEKGK